MSKIIIILFISLLCTLNASKGVSLPLQGDLISELSDNFRTGNSKGISKHFSSTVNLSLLENENVYSSAQSEIILDSFFRTHAPQKAKIIHRLDNHSNYQHVVILLTTNRGDYRVALSLKGAERELQLIEIRIEASN
jgi:hypothetical protein